MGASPCLRSASQKTLAPTDLPVPIQAAIKELQEAVPTSEVRCLHWNDTYVAAVVELPVDLPTRGPVTGIDIRNPESMQFLYHRTRYPLQAPLVFADRKDFPAERLPHLNPVRPGSPAWLCLHRGNIDDWFAEHSLTDFVRRVRGWLRDAASNRLIREEDRFEGTRVADQSGLLIYSPVDITSYVEGCWNASGGEGGHAFAMMTLLQNRAAKEHYRAKLSYQLDFIFSERPVGKLIDLFRKYNRIVGEEPEENKLVLGLFAFAPNARRAEYFGSLPTTYGELISFCTEIGVDIKSAVEEYRVLGAQMLNGVPIVVALLRPQVLIGSDSRVETLHFCVLASEEHCTEEGRWKESAPVFVLAHRSPLTARFAGELSREEDIQPSAFALVGCGALGSKLSIHLARAGHVNQTLIDSSDISPHHLVRHGLGPHYVGKNKADALREYITSTFKLDQANLRIHSFPMSIEDVLDRPGTFGKIPHLIDATASSSVLNWLVNENKLSQVVQYARGEIADEGRLGFLFWEGQQRNPRIDDLQAFLFNAGQHSLPIARWLALHKKEREGGRSASLEEIGIGISCSSTTLRLADDVVSLHASLMSAAYKKRDQWRAEGVGKIQVTMLDRAACVDAGTQTVHIPPVHVLTACNDPCWQVRIHAHAITNVSRWMKKAKKKETGGLLLGLVHLKRGVIYVTDVLPPSRDSKGTPYAFKRGTKDYPETLDTIAARTGDLIGYVGEWHTHPKGPVELSTKDMKAVREIRHNLDGIGLPTHIMVFAPGEIASFVFGRGSSHNES